MAPSIPLHPSGGGQQPDPPQPRSESPCPGAGSRPPQGLSRIWSRHESSLLAQAGSVEAGAGGPARWRCPRGVCPRQRSPAPCPSAPTSCLVKTPNPNPQPPAARRAGTRSRGGAGSVCGCTGSRRGAGCLGAPRSRSISNCSTQTPAVTRRRLSAWVRLSHCLLWGDCLLVCSCPSPFINLN